MTEKYIRTKEKFLFQVDSEFIDDEGRKIFSVNVRTFGKGLIHTVLFFLASNVEVLYGIGEGEDVKRIAQNDTVLDLFLKSDMRFEKYIPGVYKDGKT